MEEEILGLIGVDVTGGLENLIHSVKRTQLFSNVLFQAVGFALYHNHINNNSLRHLINSSSSVISYPYFTWWILAAGGVHALWHLSLLLFPSLYATCSGGASL